MDDPVNTRMRNLPTTVVVEHARGTASTGRTRRLANGDALDIVARLKEESDVPLRSHGSLSLNRALMAAGLVDRVQVTIFPVIAGQTGSGPDLPRGRPTSTSSYSAPDAGRSHPRARLPANLARSSPSVDVTLCGWVIARVF